MRDSTRSRSCLAGICLGLTVLAAVAIFTLGSNGTQPRPVAVALQALPSRISLENKLSTSTGRNIRSSKAGSESPSVQVSSPSNNGHVSQHPVQNARLISDTACPMQYPRLDAEQLKAGHKPYIYGGHAENCTMCKETDAQSQFCRKEAGAHVCSKDLQNALLSGQLNEMQRSDILTFTPCDLWPHFSGHTVWVSGDGTMEDMFRALECFMYEFLAKPVEWRKPIKLNAAQRNRLGILRVECLNFIQDTRMCYIRCDVAQCQLNHVLPFLAISSKNTDLYVANFGLQFDPNYINQLSDFAGQLKLQQHKLPQVVWKDTVPTHYSSPLGDFYGGNPPFTCSPLGGGYKNLWHSPEGHLETWDPALSSLLYGGTRNHASTQMLEAVSVPVISVYNQTVPLWQYHRDDQCTHYCFPSAPEIGVYGLFAALEQLRKSHPKAGLSLPLNHTESDSP
ncbi:TPA: hypothetical protein ACH3X2_001616 [Trebouxia sp. C0005]|nr:MAG: hypothetical protein FRX49_05579 [Trebouxia sp. A1-2]